MASIDDLIRLESQLSARPQASMTSKQGFNPNKALIESIIAGIYDPRIREIYRAQKPTPPSWATADDYYGYLPQKRQPLMDSVVSKDTGELARYSDTYPPTMTSGPGTWPDGASLLEALFGIKLFGDEKGNLYGDEYRGPR